MLGLLNVLNIWIYISVKYNCQKQLWLYDFAFKGNKINATKKTALFCV